MAQTEPSQPKPSNPNGLESQSGTGKASSMHAAPAAKPDTASPAVNDPTALIKADHRKVEQLFAAFEKASDARQKGELAGQICIELMVHTLLEEEVFYPSCQGRMERRLLDEAQVEHDGAKALINEIMHGSPDDPFFNAKVKVLSEQIKHHVREEEKPGEGILAKAKESGIATPELAKRLAECRAQLIEEAKADALGPPRTRSFRAQNKAETQQRGKERMMARGSSGTMERERDDRGRFMSDDDDDRDYRRRSSSRRDYDDDRGTMRARDDEGRFTPRSRSRDDDDDDRRRMRARDDEGRFTSRSGSRYDDDDDDRRGGGGRGWYGDPEGHSRASREGWDERGGYRSRSRYDDDADDRRSGRGYGRGGWFGDPEGHSRASREGWDDPRHGPSGWYGDREEHSRASREGWRHSDHEGSGWYGDPEGHSRASREGWDDRGRSRSRYDDDDRRPMRGRDDDGRFTSRSRSRDDDDDRQGGRGRGHGGWYGDPEGHAEAARNRR
jgi:hypothetical protein